MKNLVIVESPAKAKTIKKYLGKDFQVLASYGHVRDLIPKEGAVDPADNFAMHYQIVDRNKKHLDAIASALKNSEALYLATDPDREGEAISWHICELMRQKKILKNKPVYRIVFHQITKKAVQGALDEPREISMDMVDAQQARRALDFLVGFNLSPLLWRKIRRGLSAGRVQSPALRMIVEREAEIEKFSAQEYWSVRAQLNKEQQDFVARLIKYEDEKLQQFSVTNEKQAKEIEKHLLKAANGELVVASVEKKQRKRHPAPPFITSTLQQEAVRKLGFTAKRAMRVAQQLYEGVDIGEGPTGLITYMRTDSVILALEAISEIREVILQKYGHENLPEQPIFYKTKAKNAQEAHEAIRPTSVMRTPEEMHKYLSDEQFKLYALIWKRTVACQMVVALIDTVAVDLTCGSENNIFRANGSIIAKPGFIAVYQEGGDDKNVDGDEKVLPLVEVGEKIDLLAINADQHFTEPPPRYTEASLVKALEEHGIGRPSTYATIISTLQDRGYVILEKKRFMPTDVGVVVNRFLTNYFARYVDYNFTAELEDKLDEVARGEQQWVPLLSSFWQPFKNLLDEIDVTVQRKDVTQEAIDEKCPKCGKQLSIRLGRNGRFIGCDGYPECDYTRNLKEDQEGNDSEVVADRKCPKCDAALLVKSGRYGRFIGCSNYPNCHYMEPLEKPKDTGVVCPKCGKATILERKSRRGKVFYSCAEYPKCKYAIWNEPVAEPCPKCGWPILTIKETKKFGKQKVCPQPECGFKEDIE